MRRFFWKGLGSREGRGLASVPWDQVCRPLKLGGFFGVLKLQTMNLALLTKWLSRIMSKEEDLVSLVLVDHNGSYLEWEG